MIRAWPDSKSTGWATSRSNKRFSGLRIRGRAAFRRSPICPVRGYCGPSSVWQQRKPASVAKALHRDQTLLHREDFGIFRQGWRGTTVVKKGSKGDTGRSAIRGERSTIWDGSSNGHPPFTVCIPEPWCVHEQALTAKTVPAPTLPRQQRAIIVATVSRFKTTLLLSGCGAQIRSLRFSACPPRFDN